jgi:cell division protein FtsI/penicillin-binding protein 2
VRLRDLLGIVVGLALVGGLAYGGWLWLGDTLDGGDGEQAEPGDGAVATVRAYADAWEAGDHDGMAAQLRGEPPEDLAQREAQLRDGLEATDVTVELGDADTATDGRAVVPLTITVTSALVDDPLTWDTEAVVLRERGTWGIEWSLALFHPELRSTWTFGSEVEAVDREPILAADGTPLAGPGTQISFGFQPGRVEDVDAFVDAFERALPGSEAAAERELNRGDLNPDWFYPIVTVSPARADRARPTLRGLNGLLIREQTADRVLLDDGFGRHVVGVVAPATAEQLEELGDLYEPGDSVGQFGLEQVLEQQLVGTDRILVGLRDGTDGQLQVVLGEGQERASAPARTTIDVAVQRAVENAIGLAGDQPAAIVAVDPETGAILGAASRPLGGFNRAFSGRYPPGSTFKVVTAEALLAAGATPDDEVACPAETTVGGLRVPNAGQLDLGSTTLRQAFADSCNTTFATEAGALGADPIAEAAQRFGFGTEPLVPLSVFGGSFPAPADTAEVAAASFGQARVEVSPLHLASVMAAAVSGTWRQPYLLEDDGPGEQRSLATGARDPLRELLLAVVEDGTGTEAAVDGEQVLGKTGTAQAPDGVEHAWFVGAWGDVAFAILVEDGGSGSEVAAPIARRLVEELAAFTTGGLDPREPGARAVEDDLDDEELDEDALDADEAGPADDAEEVTQDGDDDED